MLKVLIIDDDALSRTDLKTMICWQELGFYISGEAANGFNALQLMETDMPDIVITDINMPLMNGIELIGYIEQRYPRVRIIALSAYEDFDYVRQSMKKGAIDYILKHRLNADVLLDVLKAAGDSAAQYKKGPQSVSITEPPGETAARRRTLVLKLAESGKPVTDETRREANGLGLSFDLDGLIVTAVEIDDFHAIEEKFTPNEIEMLTKTFLDLTEEILKDWEKSVPVHIGKGNFALIFFLDGLKSAMYIYNRLNTILGRIRAGIKNYLNITACFGVSGVYPDISEFAGAYNEAETILKDKFYKGKNAIFIEHTTSKLEEGFFCLDIQDEKAIYSAIKNLELESLLKLIDGVFAKISSLRLSRKSTQMICAELINIVIKISKDTGINISKLYTSEDIPYNAVQKYETLMEIKDWFITLYTKLIELLESRKIDGRLSEITRKAVEFIHRNYKQDFSQKDVAGFAGVSSPYISRLFKDECGMGFAEYLNHVRIEHAKRHIENGEYKLKEIVGLVGFNNYNYFFKVFKETVGMTPLEYESVCNK